MIPALVVAMYRAELEAVRRNATTKRERDKARDIAGTLRYLEQALAYEA